MGPGQERPVEESADEVRWLNDHEQRVWRAYVFGHQLLQERLDRDLRTVHGISHHEYEILVRLSEAPDHQMRMALLAESVCHSRSRLTHTVGRMETAGYLERVATEQDRRGVFARITDAGTRKLLDAAPTHVEGVRQNLFDIADADDLAALGRVFDRVCDRLLVTRPGEADMRSA